MLEQKPDWNERRPVILLVHGLLYNYIACHGWLNYGINSKVYYPVTCLPIDMSCLSDIFLLTSSKVIDFWEYSISRCWKSGKYNLRSVYKLHGDQIISQQCGWSEQMLL